MTRIVFILVPLCLSGCVYSAYHAAGTQTESITSANMDCAWSTADAGSGVMGVVAGPIGGAAAGASRQDRIDQCMLTKGWARN